MPTVKGGDAMRGLGVFIHDIRNCKSKEAEIRRINKELANIRNKFKADKTIDGYQKKKYVCKLLFIFLLGHEIDFGYNEAVNLLVSNKYSEKQIGYLFISVLINENSSLMKLVLQRLKDDLSSRNPVFVNLALQCIANIGSREMAENFGALIPQFLVSGDTIDSVKQSAALCLLKLIRTAPDLIDFGDWTARVIHLLNDQHMGVVTSAISLIEILVKRAPDDYKQCVSLAVSRLSRIVTSTSNDLQDYAYYFIPAPWLCVKILRLLQNYPPPEETTIRSRLTECLETLLTRGKEYPKVKKAQHSNAKHAVLLEAINLIIHMDCDPKLLVRACGLLGEFLTHRETNMRYLALESLCLLATSEFSHEAVRKHRDTVVASLKSDKDVSIRQRALDLLYAMCDKSNATEIVAEMLAYLETADYAIREEMVLKVAILSEKYAADYSWYVDTILNLIRIAGDHVSEEVWQRVIQIVVNRDDVQIYAARTVFEALQAPACHENLVKVGGFILGEFGNLIAGSVEASAARQFAVLHAKFPLCSASTRQLLLNTFVKFANLFPELREELRAAVLENAQNLASSDVEIQQRAVEYLTLTKLNSDDVLATVLEEMPPFPERDSSILAKLKKKKPIVGDNGVATTTTAANAVTQDQQQQQHTQPHSSSTQQQQQISGGGVEDLLGLSETPPPSNVTAGGGVGGGSDLLFDMLGGGGGGANTRAGDALQNGSGAGNVTSQPAEADEAFCKLIWRNSGVVLENEAVQIGIKSEFKAHLGRLVLYYGNKTGAAMLQFSAQLVPDVTQQQFPPITITVRPMATSIEGGEQPQQIINLECHLEFDQLFSFSVSFTLNSTPHQFSFHLPVTLNKFLQCTEMDKELFFQRWKGLCNPGQECQEIFNARFCPMESDKVKQRLEGFGFGLLADIDPSPNNFVSAGIIHTAKSQIGVLLRLESNQQSNMYRLTVRSTRPLVSRRLVHLLKMIL